MRHGQPAEVETDQRRNAEGMNDSSEGEKGGSDEAVCIYLHGTTEGEK